MKFSVRLVEDWKKAHKWISVQCMSASAAVLTTWGSLPDDLKSHIPGNVVVWTAVALMVAGILGRIIDQERKEDATDSK